MTDVMMGCGHAANARDAETKEPVCVICIGINDGATVVVPGPDLTGRRAKCAYYPGGGKYYTHRENGSGRYTPGIVDSSPRLAFFEHRPDEEFDKYYCGCWGWD